MSRHNARLRLARWLAAAVCALVALSGCGTPARATLTAHAPVQLASSPWYTISLPAALQDMQSLIVAPNDPTTIYACTDVVAASSLIVTTQGSFAIWRSKDAGFHWTQLATPALGGNQCQLAIAPEDARRVAVIAYQSPVSAEDLACEPQTIALSDDGGDSWLAVPSAPPKQLTPGTSGWCALQVGARYLYMEYSYLSDALGNSQVTVLERGDAGGRWTRIDTPFGQASEFQTWQPGNGDALLASVESIPSAPQTHYVPRHLWITGNGGATWRDLGALPDAVGSFVEPTPGRQALAPTPQAPWYALIAEQIPSDLYRLQVTQSSDGHRWTALPPLPIPGASAQRMGLLQALGVMPDGRLLALGPDPTQGVPPPDPYAPQVGPVPAFWLWIWSPRAGRWQVMPEPLRQPGHEGCGLCWYGQVARGADGATYLYLDRGDKAAGLFRVRVPEAA